MTACGCSDRSRLSESKGFHVFNRGKRGMVLNLQDADGQSVVQRLDFGEMDVFLINARPGVPERLGIDYESLRAQVNPEPDLPREHRLWTDRSLGAPGWRRHHRPGVLRA